MAVRKYLDENGVEHIAEYVNGKLTVVSSMPSSPTDLRTVLYVGETTADYVQGGIYQYNTIDEEWVLISTADVDLDDYETSWTGTLADWEALSADEQAKYKIVNITDDFVPGTSDHVVKGYYYENKFYSDAEHTSEIQGLVGFIYIDLPYDDLYLYDDIESAFILAGGGGSDSIIWGYYYEGSFYEEDTHTTLITPEEEYLYVDLGENSIYIYKTDAYVQISGGGNYEAGYGIKIEDDVISARTFVGTHSEWDNLLPEVQATYDTVCYTDDYDNIGEINVAYVDELPTENIQDIVYGLLSYHNQPDIVADGFLDDVELFTKTSQSSTNYIYTTDAVGVEASLDGTHYYDFESIEFNGSEFTLTYKDGTTSTLNIGDTFYWRTIVNKTYYIGCESDQTVNPIAAGGASGGSVIMVTTTDTTLYGTLVTASGSLFTNSAVFDSEGTAIIEGVKEIGDIIIHLDNGVKTKDYIMTLDTYGFYQIEVISSFNYVSWCLAGGVDPQNYSSLNDVFADEETTRELMLKHNSVDTLKTAVEEDPKEINPFCSNETSMKWLGQSSYASDKLSVITSKNLLKNTNHSLIITGITFVINPDGSIGVNGTATADVTYVLATVPDFPEDTYMILSGCPSGGSNTSYKLLYSNNVDASYNDLGEGIIFKKFDHTLYPGSKVAIFIQSGTTIDKTFYPMVRLASNEDNTYEAYKPVEAKILNSSYWEKYLKDMVPIMSSESTPYGRATASSYFSSSTYGYFYPYLAFDRIIAPDSGSGNHRWIANGTSSGWLQYQFITPICVKKVSIMTEFYTQGVRVKNFKIQGSNDSSTFVDLYHGLMPNRSSSGYSETTVYLNNDDYYMIYRLTILDVYDGSACVDSLQFYGRAYDVYVPTMTSNTAPYGEVLYSSQQNSYPAYYAFNKAYPSDVTSADNSWYAVTPGNQYVGFDFVTSVCIKLVKFRARYVTNSGNTIKNYIIQGSDTGESNDWHNIKTGVYPSEKSTAFITETINATYRCFRLFIVDAYNGLNECVQELYLFGVSYSEKEFEADTTRKWIYDHGLVLTRLENAGSGTLTMNDDNYDVYNQKGCGATVDLTPYNYARCIIGDDYNENTYNAFLIGSSISDTSGSLGLTRFTSANVPRYPKITITGVNQEACVFVYANTSKHVSVKELWVE